MIPKSSLSVLLIDDDFPTQDIIRTILEHSNCSLVIAENAKDGLAKLNSASPRPDIIIVDIFLPDIDGYQVLREIKRTGLDDQSTIVATTAYYTTDTQTEVELAGFSGYLPKPYNSTGFVTYLEQLHRKRTEAN
jgi:CheY-like chemotaxis protein